MRSEYFDIRVFAEGQRVPASAVSRNQAAGSILSFEVVLPPTPIGMSILPGTLMHVFVRRVEPSTMKEEYVLFAEGCVAARHASIGREGRRDLRLSCFGLDAAWQEIRLGFSLGLDTGYPRPRLMRLFYGLSASRNFQIVDNHRQIENFKLIQVLSGKTSKISPYFEFSSAVALMMQERGPVAGLLTAMSNLKDMHLLLRQKWNASKLYKRILYSENRKTTDYLRKKFQVDLLAQKVPELPPDTTLKGLFDHYLRFSFHHYISIASPRYNPAFRYEGSLGAVTSSDPHEETVSVDPSTQFGARVSRENEALSSAHRTGNALPSDRLSMRYRIKDFAQPARPSYGISYEEPSGEALVNARRLAKNLEVLSTEIGKPLNIHSGYRTKAYQDNYMKKAGYSPSDTSNHLSGRAADFSAKGVSAQALYNTVQRLIAEGKMEPGEVILYKGHVHYAVTGHSTARVDPEAVALEEADRLEALETDRESGVLPAFLIKPYLHFSPPPLCNLFFGDTVSEMESLEDFSLAPSRLLVLSYPEHYWHIKQGSVDQGRLVRLYFAPQVLDDLFTKMRGGSRQGDIEGGGETAGSAPQSAPQVLSPGDTTHARDVQSEAERERYEARVSEQQQRQDFEYQELYIGQENQRAFQAMVRRFGADWHRRLTMADEAEFKMQQEEAQSDDALSALLQNAYGTGDDLTAGVCYEELYRGILPTVATFPYYENGRDEEAVALYTLYQQALLSRMGRQSSFTGRLNLQVVPGFPGAVYDESFGWVLGEVVATHDVITAEGASFTTVKMGNCAFLADLEHSDAWRRIHEETLGAFAGLDRAGGVEASAFYDEDYETDRIGRTLYEPLLGCHSVVDYARRTSGSEDDYSISLGQALKFIEAVYFEQEDRPDWAYQEFFRPIATEGEVMQQVLEARPVGAPAEGSPPTGPFALPLREQLHEAYEGFYEAPDIPEEGESFMAERRAWAELYRRDLESRHYAMDVTLLPREPAPEGTVEVGPLRAIEVAASSFDMRSASQEALRRQAQIEAAQDQLSTPLGRFLSKHRINLK